MQHTCTEDGKAVCIIDCRTTLFVEFQLHTKQFICILGSILSLITPCRRKCWWVKWNSEKFGGLVGRQYTKTWDFDSSCLSSEPVLLPLSNPPSLGHSYLPPVWAPRVVCAQLGFTLSPCPSLRRFLLLPRHGINSFVILITKEDFLAHICFSF